MINRTKIAPADYIESVRVWNSRSRLKHREQRLKDTREWRKRNAAKVAAYNKAYRDANPDYYATHNQEWRKNNKARRNAQNAERYKEDPQYRVEIALRGRLRQALTRKLILGHKSPSSKALLGCSLEDFMAHLANLFHEGMTWENYGLWHIDHIRPSCTFDLTDPAQVALCFHFSNQQPLWATDNLIKGGLWNGTRSGGRSKLSARVRPMVAPANSSPQQKENS